MPLQTYTVSYSTDGSSFTALTNVQNIVANIGRQAQLQQIRSSTASVEIRYPTGFASPIADLVSGTFVKIENTTSSAYLVWTGTISDVVVQYGIPFAGGVGPADYVSLSCEGSFAKLGRMQGDGYVMASDTVSEQLVECANETGTITLYTNSGSDPVLASTTITGTWADWLARAAQSLNARLWDSWALITNTVAGPFLSNVSTINFSDTTNDSTNQVYNQINFDSLADNFYTQISVKPESFGEAVVTQVGASAPFRTYEVNTLNSSTSQATDFGNYLLANYGTAQFAISSFTCMAEAQSSFQLDKIGYTSKLGASPGTQVAVTFRGTTFQCIIEGVTMSATPAGASFTYYVSGADLNAYLILDNTVFGTLDNNKLGY
jgi:hypothetical protein